MRRREEGTGLHLGKSLRVLGMALALPVLMLLAGMRADAAGPKETPLVNLAKGRTGISASSGSITNPEYLTDGDKYCLTLNESGSKNSNGTWEGYTENGAAVSGTDVWIQLDLGASYPIEVINLKRQNYRGTATASDNTLTGTKITYGKTAVVIANEEDFSDAYVVYYQTGAGLPEGVPAPEASETYVEPMGGQWFYMDYSRDKGLGATDLGTVKNARYVRVYTQDAGAADNSVKFMELGVYGYRNEEDIQETEGRRREINAGNPMMVATAYSDDVYAIGQETEPTLQGYNTVSGRCRAIPEDLKGYTTLLLHTNNLRQFSPEHIGQAYVQAFHEHGLQIAYENDTPAILLGISASAVPGGAHWYPIRYMDLGWLDLMYRMYPNMQGTLNTENYWSGYADAVARNSAAQLEIAHRFGGYFIWADQDHGGYVERSFTNAAWKEALEKYGESCFMLYKNTSAGADDLETASYHQGHWLAGYTGGWGMLSDTWFWSNKGYAKLWESSGSYSGWQKLCGVPEALIGAQMLSTYLGGGVIYTFEFPEVVYGVENTNSPAYTHVIAPLFRYFIENLAPTREEILRETKVMIHGGLGSKDIYSGTAGTQTGVNLYETGRYGLIPAVLAVETREEAAGRLSQMADEAGLTTAPALLASGDSVLNGQARIKYFQQLYGKEYEGDAFAQEKNGSWYVYNSKVNTNQEQTATLPLEGAEGARIKAALKPHTFFILKEAEDGASIGLTLNNYRVDKDTHVFDNPQGWSWAGSIAPGQGTISGKLSVYRYMGELNVVNADPAENQQSPADNALRDTVFELTRLAKRPVVTVVRGQQPDTDQEPQYSTPAVSFDPSTGTARITVACNGWVELRISDLEYVADSEYEMDLSDPAAEGVRENLALNQSLSFSANTSGDRAVHAVDGNISGSNYSDPGGNGGGAHWLQVDLGGIQKVEEVKLYRYWADSRQYNDTVVLISPDSNFPADNTLVLWNANRDAARSWPGEGNGQTDGHTLPLGTDQSYPEEEAGKSLKVYDSQVKWLDESADREKPESGGRFEARYVRVYMNGSNRGSTNHIVELQVFGETGEVVFHDTQAPTVPMGLRAVSVSGNEAVISFRPSVDNMGLKHYEVTYKKAGEAAGATVNVDESSFTLSDLEAGSQYRITVTAVDMSGNRSAASEALIIETRAVENTEAERKQLRELITLAEKKIAEDKYTDTTVKAVQDRAAAAEELLRAEAPTKAQLAQAIADLTAAVDGLKEKEAAVTPAPWPFEDVEVISGHWKYENIKYVYENSIMNGISGTKLFRPDGNLTRAMFATVLYRMAGEPEITFQGRFKDVKEGQYYSKAVIWANSRDIVQGYSDGNYGVNDNITREQIAKMLNLFAKVQGYDISDRKALDSFTDVNQVSGWAVGFMQWATAVEMITGKPNDAAQTSFRLDPKGQATRAECAKMLTMFQQRYHK